MTALIFFFVTWPYVALSVMLCGLILRYYYAPMQWNARSSQFLGAGLAFAGPLFHAGILLALAGHIVGLVFEPWVTTLTGISPPTLALLGQSAGAIIGPAVFLGVCLLLVRRLSVARVRVTTRMSDVLVLLLIGFNALTGMYQIYIAHFHVLESVGPWLRSVLLLHPRPLYMAPVPLFIKVHIFSGLVIFFLLPFTRLVHIFSAPWIYVTLPFTLYRKRWGNI